MIAISVMMNKDFLFKAILSAICMDHFMHYKIANINIKTVAMT